MTRLFCTTAALSLLAALPATAMPALGLMGERTLVMIDTESGEVTGTMEVDGVERLLGIDLRPHTGQIVGVTPEHVIVEIDPATGAATEMATMDKMLPLVDGQPVIVDFNPAADKLRFMTGTTNHRVDVDTGAVTVDGSLAFEGNDMRAGEAPAIVAAAYINSFGKPEGTAMYDIDATIVAVIQQTSPNDGTLAAIGKLGIDAADAYAFDVATTEDGTNTAYLVAGGMIYTVSLDSGEAMDGKPVGGLDGALRDLTVLTAD